jgi:hypothetical protein
MIFPLYPVTSNRRVAPENIKRHSWLGVCLRMGWNPSLGQFNREHNDKVCPKFSNKPMVTPMVSDLSEVQLRSRAQWTCRNREASVAWRKHHQGWRFPEIQGIFEKDNSCLWQEIDGTKHVFLLFPVDCLPRINRSFIVSSPGYQEPQSHYISRPLPGLNIRQAKGCRIGFRSVLSSFPFQQFWERMKNLTI